MLITREVAGTEAASSLAEARRHLAAADKEVRLLCHGCLQHAAPFMTDHCMARPPAPQTERLRDQVATLEKSLSQAQVELASRTAGERGDEAALVSLLTVIERRLFRAAQQSELIMRGAGGGNGVAAIGEATPAGGQLSPSRRYGSGSRSGSPAHGGLGSPTPADASDAEHEWNRVSALSGMPSAAKVVPSVQRRVDDVAQRLRTVAAWLATQRRESSEVRPALEALGRRLQEAQSELAATGRALEQEASARAEALESAATMERRVEDLTQQLELRSNALDACQTFAHQVRARAFAAVGFACCPKPTAK